MNALSIELDRKFDVTDIAQFKRDFGVVIFRPIGEVRLAVVLEKTG